MLKLFCRTCKFIVSNTGAGRWTLSVSADRPIQMVNVAVTPTGDWHNLSTIAVPGPAPADHFTFSERVDGLDNVYKTGDGCFTLTLGARPPTRRAARPMKFP